MLRWTEGWKRTGFFLPTYRSKSFWMVEGRGGKECRSFRTRTGSVADLGSGAFLTPGSGIRNRFFPDPGSRIPNPYFWELIDNLLGKKFYNSLKIGPNFFLQHIKTKIMCNFVKFVATKKVMKTNFFSPLSFLLFLDPGSEIQDPGCVKIRIRDKHPGSATLRTGAYNLTW